MSANRQTISRRRYGSIHRKFHGRSTLLVRQSSSETVLTQVFHRVIFGFITYLRLLAAVNRLYVQSLHSVVALVKERTRASKPACVDPGGLCPTTQTKQLEYVQRRALQVIYGNIPYDEVHRTHNIPTLAERRLDLSRTLFKRIVKNNSNVLWYLLPAKRDLLLTDRLCCARQYSTIYARTNRYKNSLIIYGLNHWQ